MSASIESPRLKRAQSTDRTAAWKPGLARAIDPIRRIEDAIGIRLCNAFAAKNIEVVLWDGRRFGSESPRHCIRIATRRALLWLAIDPAFRFGHAYSKGELDVDGDLSDLLTRVFEHQWKTRGEQRRPAFLDRFAERMREQLRPRRGDLGTAAHYDLDTGFFRPWLDEDLVYTCAFFPTPETSLEQAQTSKLDLVCRKLDLRRDERVVELGSGWGALALHMARHYGVRVRAFNTSREQVEYAREAAARAHLSSRVEFELDDFRNATGSYDAFVSVGMLEHVGQANFASLARLLSSLLEREGRGLLHSIGRHRALPTNPWIDRYIFPGGYAPSLTEMCGILEPEDFVVLDVENLRTHYVKTLDHWRRRFLTVRSQVALQKGEMFARSWDLYLASSRASFASGLSQLYQLVVARASNPRALAVRPQV